MLSEGKLELTELQRLKKTLNNQDKTTKNIFKTPETLNYLDKNTFKNKKLKKFGKKYSKKRPELTTAIYPALI